jgi:hypothetical protein
VVHQIELGGIAFPNDIPLIIGDAVHNLRSALDIAICAKVGRGNVTPRTDLPFERTRNKLVKALNRTFKKTPVFGAPIIKLILDGIRPYETGNPDGNRPLYGLHRLDIMDKHIELMDILTVVFFGSRDITDASKLHVIHIGRPIDLANYSHPTIDISFKNIGFFQDEPVIPTLAQLSKTVRDTIDLVESY